MIKSIKRLWLSLVCMLSVAYASAQQSNVTSPMMAPHYGVAIQGACIYSEPWNNLPEGELTPMGIYQMEQSGGYEIKPFLINSAPTVAALSSETTSGLYGDSATRPDKLRSASEKSWT